MKLPISRKSVRRISARRARGAIAVEYALVLAAFALPFTMGMTIAGYGMLKNYLLARNMILESDP
jgi:Flp pilus assembly protein TadG